MQGFEIGVVDFGVSRPARVAPDDRSNRGLIRAFAKGATHGSAPDLRIMPTAKGALLGITTHGWAVLVERKGKEFEVYTGWRGDSHRNKIVSMIWQELPGRARKVKAKKLGRWGF